MGIFTLKDLAKLIPLLEKLIKQTPGVAEASIIIDLEDPAALDSNNEDNTDESTLSQAANERHHGGSRAKIKRI